MIKQILEGSTILPSPPHPDGNLKKPIIHLDDGLVLDDNILELATLIDAPPGGGKTVLLSQIVSQLLPYVASSEANIFVFDVKGELWERFGSFPGALRISPSDTSNPAACWNIFRELEAGKNPETIARDISSISTKQQRSPMQPFFADSAKDILNNTVMFMNEKKRVNGDVYGNWHLTDFLKRVSIRKDAELNWYDLAERYPKYFGHIPNYLGDELGQGYGIISELMVLLHSFWGSFNTPDGQFSCIESVKTGGHLIFICLDYANESEIKRVLETMSYLILKHSTDPENDCLNYFIIDEASVMRLIGVVEALSLGRACGLRLFAAIQNLDLFKLRMKEHERSALLALFGNLIILNAQDQISRKLLSDRYGEVLCSYTFNGAMQKIETHVKSRPVVADSDFALLKRKGDALCSFPRLSPKPFYYHGFKEELQ